MRNDILVMGAGPAGLALAGETASRGPSVACVDPAPRAAWQRTFGMWACEAAELGHLAPVEATWPRPLVELGEQGRFALGAGYCRIDVESLQRHLLARADERGVDLVAGRVVAVEHDSRGSRVRLDDGRVIEADAVVDATGARSPWVERASDRTPAVQAAFGRLLEVDSHPFEAGSMSLMDYRPIPGEDALATFLYALPLGPRRIFVEETSLAARPAIPRAVLEARLDARLRANGVVTRRVLAEEHCMIPMGIPLPVRDQRVLAFGAAAGMVHPATGYQLARALALVATIAARLAGAGSRRARLRHAHDAIWPTERRRAWELYTFGMEALLRLDHTSIRSFFQAFFKQKTEVWLPYLRGTATPAGVTWAMAGVLARLGGRARRELLSLGGVDARILVRAALGASS